jgi:TolB protein
VKLAALGTMLVLGAHAAAARRPFAWDGAWSPDGKHVVLVVHLPGRGNNNRLDIANADGSSPRTVYSSDDACCTGPIQWVSPRRIVFVDDYRTKSLDPATGRFTTIADLSDITVSPDGKLGAGWVESGGHDPERIDLITTAGRRVRTIPKAREADDTHPDFSPDGRRIVFDRARFGPRGIGPRHLYVVNTLRGPARPLGVEGSEPRWSPDGRWIAYETPPGGLAVVSSSGGKARILFRAPQLNSEYPFSWSPDSRRIAFSSAEAWRLGTVDLGGHRRLFDVRSATANGSLPRWSPDGRHLLVTGADGVVYVIGADGRGLRRL